MAQKAAKQQAARNAAALKRMHTASAIAHAIFNILRLTLRRSSTSRNSYIAYILLSAPALLVEFWFQSIGAPTYAEDGELRKAGEDLEAKGLTEFLTDLFWWTIGVTIGAGIFGDRLWWLWSIAPVYGVYLAVTTFMGLRKGLGGLTQQGEENGSQATSNRQKKMEKRGGQRVAYR